MDIGGKMKSFKGVINLVENVKLMAISILFTAAIGVLFYNSFFFFILTPISYFIFKKNYITKKQQTARNTIKKEFRDMLSSIAASFSTGKHMKESLEEAERNLLEIYEKNEIIMIELSKINAELKIPGSTDITVLEEFSARYNLEDIDDFVQVFKVCRETGGDLISAMDKTSAMISEKITIEDEISVMVSQKKFEGNIIAFMPIGIILFLRVVSPEYISILYTSFSGNILMSISLIASALAYVWIGRITNIEI